ncbi:MAG: sugar ABC transporter ATP-binding protein [Rubripirellula sp.]|nr:sugar ABC transporter ATP-binding protein [Rubripirellula sp.]
MTAPPLLQTKSLTKRYGSVNVLSDVTMHARDGEIHALVGANGAGKSTLCKIISGLVPASGGTMKFDGNDYRPENKQSSESVGIQIVQQELNLIGTLSVAENLFLTRLPNRGGVLRGRDLHHQARAVLDRFGLTAIETHTAVESLGVGHQQMVEIATALARDCRLLILDEPTAALTGRESQQLFEHLRRLRDEGVGIIYISHRLDEVASLSDRITILRDGRFVETRDTASMTTDEMIALMSGEEAAGQIAEHQTYRRDEIAMRVRQITSGFVNDVSFDVRRGERFGITGLIGSGRTELLRAIFGADVATAGEVELTDVKDGQLFSHPADAVAAGLAMVTEDRKQNGLLLSQSIITNTTLCSLRPQFSRGGLLRIGDEERIASSMVTNLETHCEHIDQSVGTLSGGNQQKIAIAKWLVHDAEVFLFDEPTRGIDVAARRRIYRLIESLAKNDKACVIVSSDLEELLETCDAIAVMCDGKMVETFQRDKWSREKIMQASFSGYVS